MARILHETCLVAQRAHASSSQGPRRVALEVFSRSLYGRAAVSQKEESMGKRLWSGGGGVAGAGGGVARILP